MWIAVGPVLGILALIGVVVSWLAWRGYFRGMFAPKDGKIKIIHNPQVCMPCEVRAWGAGRGAAFHQPGGGGGGGGSGTRGNAACALTSSFIIVPHFCITSIALSRSSATR